MTTNQTSQKQALERILTALSPQNVAKGSARMLLYGTAAATIYAVAGGDPTAVAVASPIVGRLIETIGGNVLADFIDSVAQDKEEKLSAADIQRQVAELFEQVQPTDYLSEQEYYRATRIREQRHDDRHQISEERNADRHQEALKRMEQIGQKLTQPDDEAALKIYMETVARQNGRLPLGPLDPSGRESSQLSLHQVFISLNAGAVINAISQKVDRIWIFREVLGHIYFNTRMILLGDPGSGKSTLLRYLTFLLANSLLEYKADWIKNLAWTESKVEPKEAVNRVLDELRTEQSNQGKRQTKRMAWPAPLPIPILLNLRDLAATDFDPASSTAIWEFVAGQLEKEDMGQAVAALRGKGQQGKLLFLLDGVDEVPLTKRPHIWQAIQAHDVGVYGGNRWVTTCRILSFNAEEAPKVPVRTIEPFDSEQIDQFIDHWYSGLHSLGELSQEKADNMGRQLKAAARRKGLRRLAPNPMLLTIMALVQTYHGTLPDERARLYQQCVETFLLRWQRHKEADQDAELPDVLAQLGTTQENLERLLWEIAWQAHKEQDGRDEAADIPEGDVFKIARSYLGGSYAKAEQFIEYTERRAHLLIGRGGQNERMFTFPHRTFQEYLAACHLASQRRFGREAAKLAAESDSWREVLNLAAGTLVFNQKNREKAVDGIDDVCPKQMPDAADGAGWQRVWLAGEMAAVVGKNALQMDEVGRELLPRLQQMLAALLDGGRLTTQQRAEAGTALAALGDLRLGVCTKEPLMLPVITKPERFTLREKEETVVLQPFAIAKYPVTNAQFGYFIADGGYSEKWRNCWSDKGWGWKEKYGWVEPRIWHIAEFNQTNQPVVGVSWYEAEAFAKWLSQTTGNTYCLAPEAEWKRAAGHSDGREYPWGDKWQMNYANINEAGLGRTSVVGMFPLGQAVCGADDLAGNVWEWTSSWFDERNVTRVLCGGSLNDFHQVEGVANRDWGNPFDTDVDLGFRVVSPVVSGF